MCILECVRVYVSVHICICVCICTCGCLYMYMCIVMFRVYLCVHLCMLCVCAYECLRMHSPIVGPQCALASFCISTSVSRRTAIVAVSCALTSSQCPSVGEAVAVP